MTKPTLLLLALSVVEGLLPGALFAQPVAVWGPSVAGNLPALSAGPVAAVAANLSSLNLNSRYGEQVLSPIAAYLNAQRLTPQLFQQKSPSERAGLLQQAIAAQSASVDERAGRIFHDYSEGLTPAGWYIENASGVEDMLLYEHVYMEAGKRERLVAIHPALKKGLETERKTLLTNRIQAQARKLAAAEDESAPVAVAQPQALSLTSMELTETLSASLEDIARDAVAAGGDAEGWDAAVAAAHDAQGAGDRAWVAALRERLAPLIAAYEKKLSDGWLDTVSKGQRPEPSGGFEALTKLDVLLAKADPQAAALPGDDAGREELTRMVYDSLLALKPVAMDYVMGDGRLSPDQWTVRASAWAAALDPFMGYPGRKGSETLSAADAAKILKALKSQLKEFRAAVEKDPLLQEDDHARKTLAGQADVLAALLARLAQ